MKNQDEIKNFLQPLSPTTFVWWHNYAYFPLIAEKTLFLFFAVVRPLQDHQSVLRTFLRGTIRYTFYASILSS